MGKLTHTVSGSIASFKSPDKSPIESLKVHFTPIQEGTGNPSPTNVRAISGWTGFNSYSASKNIGHVIGYSTESITDITTMRKTSNSYGTTINTTNYEGTTGELVITQSEWPNSTVSSYKNGYVTIVLDNIVFNKQYDVSFKITNILNNPLETGLNNIRLSDPSGYYYCSPAEIVNGNIVIFKNMTFAQNTAKPNNTSFDVRICGLSFTLSEFMVTPVNQNDGVFEPYKGSVIPVTIPAGGKNLLDVTKTDSIVPGVSGSTITISNGALSVDAVAGSARTHVKFSQVFPAGTYTIQSKSSGSVTSAKVLFNTQISSISYNSFYEAYPVPTSNGNVTFTLAVPFKLGLVLPNKTNESGNPGSLYDIQLELGSTATDYEPYMDALYGGYVDLVTGNVIAEYCSHTFDGTERINISSTFTGTNGQRYDTNAMDFAKPQDSTAISDKAKTLTSNPANVTELSFRSGSGAWRTMFFVPDDLFEGENNAVNFANWLSENNVTIVEHYETPVTIATITPTELKSFKDQNNILSNANGNIECTYELKDHLLKKRRTFMTDHKVTTTPSPVANFKSRIKGGILDSCIVDFSPVQSGTGDPSPTNVRPISGWTGANVWRTGANLIDDTKRYQSSSTILYIGATDTGRNFFFKAGKYTVTRDFNGELIGVYYVKRDSTSEKTIFNASATETTKTITIAEDGYYAVFCYRASASGGVDTSDIKSLMIEPGETASTYEPYIGQSVSVTFPALGKNLFDKNNVTDGKVWWNGNTVTMSDFSASAKIPVIPEETYNLNRIATGNNTVCFFDIDGTYLQQQTGVTGNVTIPSGAYFAAFSVMTEYLDTAMFEKGSTASPYESYNATAYGGYIDLVTGEIYKSYDICVLSGNKTLYMSDSYIRENMCDAYLSLNGYIKYSTRNIYCNMLKPSIGTWGKAADPNTCCCNATQFHMNFANELLGVTDYTQETQASVKEKINTYLGELYDNGTPLILSYEMATPELVGTLTPIQLKTLLGTNNIWSDTNGNTTVTYWTR